MSALHRAGPLPLAIMAALALSLVIWPEASRYGNCLGAALFVAPFWIFITLGETERARMRRYAFLSYYLTSDKALARWLSPGLGSWFWQGSKGLVLALLLLIGVPALAPAQRLLLLLDLPILVLLQDATWRWLASRARAEVAPILARQLTQWINAVLLWLALVLVALLTPQADYSRLPWQEVVQHAASGVSVGCDALALLARIQAVAGALSSWAAQHLFVGLERPEQLLLAWSFFVAWFGVSLVLAWAFSRSLLGVSARPWRVPGVSSPG